MSDMGHRDDVDTQMENLELMMKEVVKCMEAVAEGGANFDIESDKKRRAQESVGLQGETTASRESK